MSLTGKLQGIAARGYRLIWSVVPAPEPEYNLLTLSLVDGRGGAVLSNSQRVKARGGVVTRESEEAQKNALITWAYGVTMSQPQSAEGIAHGVEEPIPPPTPEPEPTPPTTEAEPASATAAGEVEGG